MVGRCLWQVLKGIKEPGLPGLSDNLFRFSVGMSEFRALVSQEDYNTRRVSVHRRFLARSVVDPQHSDAVMLYLDFIVLRVNLDGGPEMPVGVLEL